MTDLDAAIGRYHDQHIAPTTLHGVPDDAQAAMRARYIEDVKNNPVALWQVAVATIAENSRERLARHLYIGACPDFMRYGAERDWNAGSDRIDFTYYRSRADELLAVIAGDTNHG